MSCIQQFKVQAFAPASSLALPGELHLIAHHWNLARKEKNAPPPPSGFCFLLLPCMGGTLARRARAGHLL